MAARRLSEDAQAEINLSLLRAEDVTEDPNPFPKDQRRPYDDLGRQLVLRFGDVMSSSESCVDEALFGFYDAYLGVDLRRVSAPMVVERPSTLLRPLQLVVCERGHELALREQTRVSVEEGHDWDEMTRWERVRVCAAAFLGVFRSVMRLSAPSPDRAELGSVLPLMMRIVALLDARFVRVIPVAREFSALFPPPRFWSATADARRSMASRIDSVLRKLLLSTREAHNPHGPYGLWVDRGLSPIPDGFWDDPETHASATTLLEELLAYLFSAVRRDESSLAHAGLSLAGRLEQPFPVLCGTVHPPSGKLVCVRPELEVTTLSAIRLTLVTREEAMKDSRMRIRRVVTP